MTTNLGHLSRKEIDEYTSRPRVLHRNFIGRLPAAPFNDANIRFEVPFAVRRVDVAFIAYDGQDTHQPLILQIDGITDGHTLATTFQHMSPVFSMYYEPPIYLSGANRLRLLSQIDPNSRTTPAHDCGFSLNLAFHNEYDS